MTRNPRPRVKVKICGNTRLEDAVLSAELGADALGFIFYRKSPRWVSQKVVKDIVAELPPFIETVGVFVNETADRINRIADACRLSAVQLHGDESPAFCKKIRRKVIKAFRIKDRSSVEAMAGYEVGGYLVDAFHKDLYGGTGQVCDWNLVKQASRYGPLILAGGINPGNVQEAIRQVKPFAVDVCSGVEKTPGIKDREKLKKFFQEIYQ